MTAAGEVLRCSFCNKRQQDVVKLIAGPNVYICNECVDICDDILEKDGIPGGGGCNGAVRWTTQAEKYLSAATLLLGSGEPHLAAQDLRHATVAALRGLLILAGEDADSWQETRVVADALSLYPAVATLLHIDDQAHVLLRLSIHGAQLGEDAVASAARVVRDLIAFLRQETEAWKNRREEAPRASP